MPLESHSGGLFNILLPLTKILGAPLLMNPAGDQSFSGYHVFKTKESKTDPSEVASRELQVATASYELRLGNCELRVWGLRVAGLGVASCGFGSCELRVWELQVAGLGVASWQLRLATFAFRVPTSIFLAPTPNLQVSTS